MRRRNVERFARPGARERSFVAPLAFGLAMWIGFPTHVARQDIASLVAGLDAPARWDTYVEAAAAGSVHQAELPFAPDPDETASISGAGIKTPGIGMVAFRGKRGIADDIPDEARINRSEKGGRLLKIAPVAPPKAFTAGSILKRQSFLLKPSVKGEMKMAFARTDIKGEELKIAEAFHPKIVHDPNAGMPKMLAALVNNDHPDILATAYASTEPDYARKSPFETLLKNEKPDAGRFIPPMEPGDHSWVSSPLPPEVFSKPEQRCLTAAIYFEARGESVKGQAAVAQVVLNRVRNPAYPKTICAVVYQNDDWRNACQFSFACDGIKERVTEPKHWKMAEEVAMAVTAGKIWLPDVGSATHYHATYVHPRWAHAMEMVKKIGKHLFYRTYGGGWS
ncbi:MAG TPA: cell wall hydrolase [Rhizobiaceae bacterium]|nr:cell wall hydrolase [Rhizobiaceae bacterium]